MKSNSFKNIIIFLLVLLLAYQTVELWFRDISSHNFFSTFLPSTPEISDINLKQHFYHPYRILHNLGKGEFKIFYQNIGEKLKETSFIDVLNTVNDISYVESGEIDYSKIMQTKSFIYQYNFLIDTSFFTKSLGIKESALSKTENFDNIVITPNFDTLASAAIYFMDSESNTYYKYISQLKTDLYKTLNDALNQNPNGLLYESSKMKGWEFFTDNVYYPVWEMNSYIYSPLKVENPYLSDNNEEVMDTIKSKTDEFFDNPMNNVYSRWPKKGETEYFINSDGGQKAVKYYLKNKCILEYTNFGDFSNYKKTSLLDDYSAATSFVERDQFVKNQFFLHSFEQNDDQRTFYYDLAVNDLEVMISDKTVDLSHHIEVTVENGIVVKYKKLVLTYSNAGTPAFASNNFEQLMNLISEEQKFSSDGDNENTESIKMDDIHLIYKVEIRKIQGDYTELFLYWAINKNGNIFRPA